MKITIITITYNNLEGLKNTVNSVIDQTDYNDIEYIIIDGDSSDGTKEFLQTLPAEIKWISEKDRGISHAFNKGLDRATGEYILCLNSGDTFIDNRAIANVVKYLDNCCVDLLSFKVQVNDDTFIPSVDNEMKILEACDLPHQGTFVSSKCYEIIGEYSEEYHIRMDYHFFARCKKQRISFEYIPEVIVKYEPGGVSMKKENRIRFWKEGMTVKLMYNLKISFKDMVKFIMYRKRI